MKFRRALRARKFRIKFREILIWAKEYGVERESRERREFLAITSPLLVPTYVWFAIAVEIFRVCDSLSERLLFIHSFQRERRGESRRACPGVRGSVAGVREDPRARTTVHAPPRKESRPNEWCSQTSASCIGATSYRPSPALQEPRH